MVKSSEKDKYFEMVIDCFDCTSVTEAASSLTASLSCENMFKFKHNTRVKNSHVA
jgi:hypothetical protein